MRGRLVRKDCLYSDHDFPATFRKSQILAPRRVIGGEQRSVSGMGSQSPVFSLSRTRCFWVIGVIS